MDFNTLKDSVANLTLYDIKAGVRKVQNAVMNFTEMESKVREATNNEPWGASSTLMQEIANGTFNYQTLNEIMPMIYRRFTEKTAEEWRQIYKALQLLEFLIKHGSERVIDDARNHLTLLKMLRQFHFIDQNGKDQGINVRNRAKELTELLGDVDRIRAERKKARVSKNKYIGVEGGAGFSSDFSSGGGGRYGGFGSESAHAGGSSDTYGGYSGGVYGDGGGFGGQTNDYTSSRRDKFEEYDEFDGNGGSSASASRGTSSRAKKERSSAKHRETAPKPEKAQKAPEVDLFSFDDPIAAPAAAPAPAPATATAAAPAAEDDDEFDDFQSATPATQAPSGSGPGAVAPIAAPKPVSAPHQANLSNMMAMASISPAPSSTGTPAANYSSFGLPSSSATAAAPNVAPATAAPMVGSSGPNYFSSVQSVPSAARTSTAPSGMGMGSVMPAMNTGGTKPATTAASSGGGDAFGALWSQASSSLAKKPAQTQAGPSMGQLAKEKSSAGIWGAAGSAGGSSTLAPAVAKPQGGSASNDLADLLG
ncbi:ENTH domain-containing protein [Ceratocystis lukuohia]